MKKFFSKFVATMTIVGLQMPHVVYAAPACPAKSKEIRLDVETVQQFLDYMDLEAMYMSGMEEGAPGFFVAIPQMVIFDAKTTKPIKAPQDMFGYYFKGTTRLASSVIDYSSGGYGGGGAEFEESDGGYSSGVALDNEYTSYIFKPFNDAAKSSIGQTGFPGYPCVRDGNKDLAKIDVSVINKAESEEELKKSGIVYHPAYPAALKAAPGLPLTLVDKQIALGKPKIDDKYVPTADEQKLLLKASAAKLTLKRLITGMRIVPGKDSGIVVDCQPTASEKDPSGYFGGVLLPIIITPDSWLETKVDVQVIWNTGTVKEIGGRKFVVDANGKPLKADGINFYGNDFGGDFIWWKRPDGKNHNAQTHIQAYLDMGYKYEYATTQDVACEPKIKTNTFCGMIAKDNKDNLLITTSDNDHTIINNVKNSSFYGGSKTDISAVDYAAIAGAQCGCVDGAATTYNNQDYENYENSVYLNYLLFAKNPKVGDIKSCVGNKNVFKMFCGRFTKDEKGRLFIHDTPYNDVRIIAEKNKVDEGIFTSPIDDAAAKKIFARKAGECGCVTGVMKYYSKPYVEGSEGDGEGDSDYFAYLQYASDSTVKKDSACTKEGL